MASDCRLVVEIRLPLKFDLKCTTREYVVKIYPGYVEAEEMLLDMQDHLEHAALHKLYNPIGAD